MGSGHQHYGYVERAVPPATAGPMVRFIREVLGCGCPDEVLRSIRRTNAHELPKRSLSYDRVDVGGRLLIYLVDTRESIAQSTIVQLLVAGRQERDQREFNRFRLVLAAAPSGLSFLSELAERAVARQWAVDERVHVHVLEVDQLPPRGPAPTPSVAGVS